MQHVVSRAFGKHLANRYRFQEGKARLFVYNGARQRVFFDAPAAVIPLAANPPRYRVSTTRILDAP